MVWFILLDLSYPPVYNKWSDSWTSPYQEEDDAGNLGVRLSKELMAVAGEALKTNVTTLGPLVLPFSEQVCEKDVRQTSLAFPSPFPFMCTTIVHQL